MIRVGQVGGAYGLEGAVKVIPLTDFEDRFSPGATVMLEGAEREVEWSRPAHQLWTAARHDCGNSRAPRQ